MSDYNKNSYNREYNKQAYKTVKVYIPVEEYEAIKAHYEANGHKAMSGYVKALIDADMKAGEKQTPSQSVSIQGQKNVVMGSNHGNINIQ